MNNPDVEIVPEYMPTGAQETYYMDERVGSALRVWRIKSKGMNLLLPCPVNAQKFETVRSFNCKGQPTPKTIKECLPAILKLVGRRWEIAKEGVLSDEAPKDKFSPAIRDTQRMKSIGKNIDTLTTERDALKQKIDDESGSSYSI